MTLLYIYIYQIIYSFLGFSTIYVQIVFSNDCDKQTFDIFIKQLQVYKL